MCGTTGAASRRSPLTPGRARLCREFGTGSRRRARLRAVIRIAIAATCVRPRYPQERRRRCLWAHRCCVAARARALCTIQAPPARDALVAAFTARLPPPWLSPAAPSGLPYPACSHTPPVRQQAPDSLIRFRLSFPIQYFTYFRFPYPPAAHSWRLWAVFLSLLIDSPAARLGERVRPSVPVGSYCGSIVILRVTAAEDR
ncbi:hypothetical protein BC834DRAFT_471191 [Gloeopeniophorella convolvens]|nr:hypothetical protein BC834DRAFT_471191 [Gloeopeniophorella convolvens]